MSCDAAHVQLAVTSALPVAAATPAAVCFLLGAIAGGAACALAARWFVGRRLGRAAIAAERATRAQRLAEMGAMSAGLAHEIKNPLSTIGLNAQLLAESIEQIPMEDEARAGLSRRLGSLRREADRLKGILTDFLDFAGELRLDRREADANAVVEELVDFYLPQAERAGVRVRADLSPGPLRAWIDAPLIKQALLNLMLNATQAMEQADAAPGTHRELILKTAPGLGENRRPAIVLHVIDTGPGMSRETRERLFEPYFTTKPGGTGLGLPTTRRIIEGHGGSMTVYSEPGRGTDFVVTLPVSAPPV